MMMTGTWGNCALTFSNKFKPLEPGMRMSLTKTCGSSFSADCAKALSTSCGLVKLRVGRFSRSKAFSSTKRID